MFLKDSIKEVGIMDIDLQKIIVLISTAYSGPELCENGEKTDY